MKKFYLNSDPIKINIILIKKSKEKKKKLKNIFFICNKNAHITVIML